MVCDPGSPSEQRRCPTCGSGNIARAAGSELQFTIRCAGCTSEWSVSFERRVLWRHKEWHCECEPIDGRQCRLLLYAHDEPMLEHPSSPGKYCQEAAANFLALIEETRRGVNSSG